MINKDLNQHNLYIHKAKTGYSLYECDDLAIFFMEGISHSYHVFKEIENRNPWFFVQLPWHHNKELMRKNIEFFEDVTKLDRQRLVLLANSHVELGHAISLGLKFSRLVPQNCFLDYSLFSCSQEEKKYDLVINCRPENWKRPHLASSVDNLAVIKGANHRPNEFFDLSQLNPKFMNDERISVDQISNILGQSICGGIFSAVEGGCYSSSEYLLSGLPVVSTQSLGGRDMWYNEKNSVIVEPDSNRVAEAVRKIKRMLNAGDMSPEEIRSDHIKLSNYFRGIFIDMIDNVSRNYGVDAQLVFDKNYKHKFTRYTKI